MAVWPYMMSGAAVTIAVSAFAGNSAAIRSSALIFVGLLGARAIHASPISGEYRDVVFAAMWGLLASFTPIVGYGSIATAACVKAAVLICALCSLWGRLTDYTVQMWSPPYMTADLMLILAMVLVCWSVRGDLVFRFSAGGDGGGRMVADHCVCCRGHNTDLRGLLGREAPRQKEMRRP